VGEWRSGVKEGEGFIQFDDGRKLYGDFIDNSLVKTQKLVLPEDSVYEGDVSQEGLRDGEGRLYDSNHELIYSGSWKNDKMKDGVMRETLPYDVVHVRKYLKGTMSRTGKYTWPDGSVFTGRMENGKKVGFGRFVWANGSDYEGDWENDNRHGKGTYQHNGICYHGSWVNDSLHGQGTISREGYSMDCSWRSGELYGESTETNQDQEVVRKYWREGKEVTWSSWYWSFEA
jgi:hypothetical protein